MLSELATCLYELTATQDNGLWDPRHRQFLSESSIRCLSSALSARAWDQQILPEPEGQEGEAWSRPRTQRAGVLGVIDWRSPHAIGFRPAGDLSGELR